MPSANGPEGPVDPEAQSNPSARGPSIELNLFESLVHHLVEKGVLTKNDALSVVQTVAEVERGQRYDEGLQSAVAESELNVLRRLYASFEILSERLYPPTEMDGEKVLQLRPPIHGGKPRFPTDD